MAARNRPHFSYRRKSFDESVKKPQNEPSGTVGRNLGFLGTAFLGFQTLGSIYGMHLTDYIDSQGISEQVRFMYLQGINNDIMAHSRIFPGSTGPSPEDILGAVSCIVWSLTLVPLIKYSWLVLRAGDDQGEGISALDLN